MEIDEIDAMLGEDENVYAKARNALSAGSQFKEPTLGPGDARITDPPVASRGGSSGIPDESFIKAPQRTGGPSGPTSATQPFGADDPFKRTATNPQGISLPYDEKRDGPMSDYNERQDIEVPRAPTHPGNVPGAAPVAGGALAMYGTGDIPGGESVQWAHTNMPGFNTAGWGSGERGTNSIKNTAGKLFTTIPPKPSAMASLVASEQFQRWFPGATFDGKDKIDFGDGFPVDVLVNADTATDTADNFAWQTSNPADAAGGGAAGALSGMGGAGAKGPVPGPTPDESTLADIMATLNALANGDEDPLVKKEIERLLGEASPTLTKQIAPLLSGKNVRGSSGSPPGVVPTGRHGGVR